MIRKRFPESQGLRPLYHIAIVTEQDREALRSVARDRREGAVAKTTRMREAVHACCVWNHVTHAFG